MQPLGYFYNWRLHIHDLIKFGRLHSLGVFKYARGALTADQFAAVVLSVGGVSAENTGGLVLFQDNFFVIDVNFQGVLFVYAHCTS